MSIKMLTAYLAEPTVYHTPEAYRMRMEVVGRCEKEVGWIGLGDELPNGDWLIDELVVLPQEVMATECEFEDEAVADWCEDFLNRGGDTTRFILWGHSHVDMATSPSSTDYTQAAKYIKDCPLFICAIYNKKGHSRHDVYYRDLGYMFDDVDSHVWIPQLTTAESEALDATLKANISNRKFVAPAYNKGGVVVVKPKQSYKALQAMKNLPAKAMDCDNKELKAAGFKEPRAAISSNGTDYLGLTMDDYIQYFIDQGENGSSTEVYTHMFDIDPWTAGAYGNQYGAQSDYLFEDEDY
jgi:hypothetical protein